jgi:hypothetical protein
VALDVVVAIDRSQDDLAQVLDRQSGDQSVDWCLTFARALHCHRCVPPARGITAEYDMPDALIRALPALG